MKNLIKILLFVGMVFSQEKTFTFTESEILGFTKQITDLQVKDSLNTKIQINLEGQVENCELIVDKHKLLITELEKQLELKDDLNKEIKPKWHENKYLWFGYGIVAIILPTWVLGNVK